MKWFNITTSEVALPPASSLLKKVEVHWPGGNVRIKGEILVGKEKGGGKKDPSQVLYKEQIE